MNKKLLAPLLCSTFLFGISACGSHDAPAINEQATSKKQRMRNLAARIRKKNFLPM